MTKMYDPQFNPLFDLEYCKTRLDNLEANFARLVDAHNAQGALIKQIAQQNTELLEMYHFQKIMQEHHLKG